MKNTFGNSITLTLFGESHGKGIGAVLDGLAAGIEIDKDYIQQKLQMRKPYGAISTARVENDEFEIISGVFNGKTTGAPLCVMVENKDVKCSDYTGLVDIPRPSHADYTANCKYNGYQDYRGGGHFSGRVTVAIVCALAIVQQALERKGIYIGSHISYSNGIKDENIATIDQVKKLNQTIFPVIDEKTGKDMQDMITQVAKQGDSVGGVLETAVFGLPVGLGEPWFDSLESQLSHAIFSVPAVKGIEFGLGFGFADQLGSKANDLLSFDGEKVVTDTNNNGGINGGISNGMPIIFKTAIKPTPSISVEQNTLRLSTMQKDQLVIKGRHDPAIIHRARVVVDSLTALVVADMLAIKYGTDYLAKN